MATEIKLNVGDWDKIAIKLIDKLSEAIGAINHAYWRRERAKQYLKILAPLEDWYGLKLELASCLDRYIKLRSGSDAAKLSNARRRLETALLGVSAQISNTKRAVASLGPTVGKRVRPLLIDLAEALAKTDYQRREWVRSVLDSDGKSLRAMKQDADQMAVVLRTTLKQMGEVANEE